MQEVETSTVRRSPVALLWASLLPLLFLLRPYGGIRHDARIYIGRGLADRDPTGLGRDILFAHDAQTGFSLFRPIVGTGLAILPAGEVSILLVSVGLVAWLIGAAALMRRIVPAEAAWAATGAVLVLPSAYGAFGVFHYAEAIATPRLFAEAAVLGGLALLLDGRRWLGWGLLGLALAFHPLMALPGIALAIILLVGEDRRWLFPIAAAAAVLLMGAAVHAPLVGRLFVQMDPTWLNIVRHRTFNLFPSLWPAEDGGRIVCQAVTVILAGSLADFRIRRLLWGGVCVALLGTAAALVFGDLVPSILVLQMQPWRALWLLTLLGNASLALVAVRLWRADPGGRLMLALLILAWSAQSSLVLEAGLAVAIVVLRVADRNNRLRAVSPRVGSIALAAALLGAAFATMAQAGALIGFFGSLGVPLSQIGPWSFILESGVLALPILAAAVALVLSAQANLRLRRAATLTGVMILAGLATVLSDGRADQTRLIDAGSGAAELNRLFGDAPGEVLWIDGSAEPWFLLGRPDFWSAVQGAPLLFSRDLALEWADRADLLVRLGLLRPSDLTPWAASGEGEGEIHLTAAGVAGFCADRRHPAGLVIPGSQRDSVPPDLPSRLWTPPRPFLRRWTDAAGLHWSPVPIFTAVQCIRSEAMPPASTSKVGDD